MVWQAAAAQAGGDIASSAVSFGFGRATQEDQQDFIRQMYKHRYQYTVEDMKLAGLNPILAAMGGAAGAAPGGALPGTPKGPEFGATAKRYAESKARSAAETELGTRSDANVAAAGRAASAASYDDARARATDVSTQRENLRLQWEVANPAQVHERGLGEASPGTFSQMIQRYLTQAGLGAGEIGETAHSAKDVFGKVNQSAEFQRLLDFLINTSPILKHFKNKKDEKSK